MCDPLQKEKNKEESIFLNYHKEKSDLYYTLWGYSHPFSFQNQWQIKFC